MNFVTLKSLAIAGTTAMLLGTVAHAQSSFDAPSLAQIAIGVDSKAAEAQKQAIIEAGSERQQALDKKSAGLNAASQALSQASESAPAVHVPRATAPQAPRGRSGSRILL